MKHRKYALAHKLLTLMSDEKMRSLETMQDALGYGDGSLVATLSFYRKMNKKDFTIVKEYQRTIHKPDGSWRVIFVYGLRWKGVRK